jgi:hypothetical protein
MLQIGGRGAQSSNNWLLWSTNKMKTFIPLFDVVRIVMTPWERRGVVAEYKSRRGESFREWREITDGENSARDKNSER